MPRHRHWNKVRAHTRRTNPSNEELLIGAAVVVGGLYFYGKHKAAAAHRRAVAHVGPTSAPAAQSSSDMRPAAPPPSNPLQVLNQGSSTPVLTMSDHAANLQDALMADGCRQYDESYVRAFQAAAKIKGTYLGAVDGYYGPGTRAALAQEVGSGAAPPCFPAHGGPLDRNYFATAPN